MLRKRPPRPRPAEARAGEAAPKADAVTEAIEWLARRDFCSAELAARLAARGHETDAIQAALLELRGRRYLDDERYAQQFVAAHAARGQGPVRLRRDLDGLGVPAELIDAALQGFAEGVGWAQLARQVRSRRFGAAAPAREQWARQARFLQYRGFSYDDIRAALGEGGDPD